MSSNRICLVSVEDILMDVTPNIWAMPDMLLGSQREMRRALGSLEGDTEFLATLPTLPDAMEILDCAERYFGKRNVRVCSFFWGTMVAHPSLRYWIRKHIPKFEGRLVKVPDDGFKTGVNRVLVSTVPACGYTFRKRGGDWIEFPTFHDIFPSQDRLKYLEPECKKVLERCGLPIPAKARKRLACQGQGV
jgi:hypothetical protein